MYTGLKRPLALLLIGAATASWLSVAHAQVTSHRFYERKAEGWFWYAREPEPEPEIEPEEVVPQTSAAPETPSEIEPAAMTIGTAPAPLSSAWLKENMPKYLMAAIDNPTVDNVKTYLYLQRIAMDRAEQYASATQMVTLGDPFLDETIRRPLSEFAVSTVDSGAGVARNRLVTEIAQKAGIFVFFSSKCALCEVQAPLLKSLAQHEGFSLIPISLDGKNLSQNPFEEYKVDDGHSEMLDVRALPALYLATPNGEFAPLGQGAFALPDLQQRIIVAAKREGWITDEQFNTTRPIVNYDNLAHILESTNTTELLAQSQNETDGFIHQDDLLRHIRSAIGAN